MEIHHICIQTACYEESLSFYTALLGFECIRETPGFHGRSYNTWLRKGSFHIELQTAKAGDELIPWNARNAGPVHLCFSVPDVKVSFEEMKQLGARFKLKEGQPLYQVENGLLFKLLAPEGTEIEIRDTAIQENGYG